MCSPSTSSTATMNKTSATPHSMDNKVRQQRAEVIEPGLVVLRQFIDDGECQRIAKMAKTMGSKSNGEDGFYTTDKNGQSILNTGEARGRIYDRATRFPPELIRHSDNAVSTARSADACMPQMDCTHLLLNMYTTCEGLVWHRDIYENDGKSDHPVVNLSIGATCVFGFKHEDTDEDRTVLLRSGDALLFGGPCRLIKHAVLSIDLDECPQWMKDDPCRFSFTFRNSPEVLGREHEFKYFRVQEHLVGQESFQKPINPKSFRGLPSHATQKRKMIPHRKTPSSRRSLLRQRHALRVTNKLLKQDALHCKKLKAAKCV